MSQALTLERTDVGVSSVVRRPRGTVFLDSNPMTFLSFEVEKRSHFTADIWSVEIEAWQQPEGFGITYWADAVGAIVEIKVGFLLQRQDVDATPGAQISLIIGQVDDVEIDPLEGLIRLHGRSLAAKLIDTKTTNKWADHTASQIAEALAREQGLTPQVTATKTPIGQYYDNHQYASINRSISEWELLTFLAQKEGFELYVIGTTLYFGPAIQDPNPLGVWVQHNDDNNIWSNTTNLKLRRSLTLAQDITVSVITHDYWKNRQLRVSAGRRSRALGGQRKITPQTRQAYILRRPGLSQEQAQQLASKTLDDLTKFERTIEATLEGDPLMTPQRQVRFYETGSSFDQIYYVDKVTHSFSWEKGYEMNLHGKNIPATSTELLVQGTPAEILPPADVLK